MTLSKWIKKNEQQKRKHLLVFGIAWLAICPIVATAFVLVSTQI